MKAWLGVIASLSISPAYAFENLIIDSAFQNPVVLTDRIQNNVWTNVSNGPLLPFNFGPMTGSPGQNQHFAATTVIIAVPNPFVGASPANLTATTNLPGNSGTQLASPANLSATTNLLGNSGT